MDAVKKRAIKTVASYEEFKHRVACAHLTPMSRKEIRQVVGGQPPLMHGWVKGRRSSSKSRVIPAQTKKEKEEDETKEGRKDAASSSISSSSSSSSSSSMAFEKEWLRLMKAGKGVGEKLAFLQSVGGAGFVGRCFGKGKKEMAAEVLGDVLVTLREGMKEERGRDEKSSNVLS